MKTIISTLFLCTLALCELPPPYSQRGFRPSPTFLSQSSRYPQSSYGPPSQQLSTLDVSIPSKLTIEQLIRITEKLQSSSHGRVVNRPTGLPQNSYLPPPREPQQAYGPPSKFQASQLRPPSASQPQIIYGVPQSSEQTFRPINSTPQNQFVPPQSQSFPNNVQNPQNQYVPPQSSNFQRPQTFPNKFQTPHNQYVPPQTPNGQNVPQNSYGVPLVQQPSGSSINNQLKPQVPPSTNYGVPDTRNIETLGEQQNSDAILRQSYLNYLKMQELPYNRAPQNFKPQQGQSTQSQIQPSISQQYLPSLANGASGVGQAPQNAFAGGQNANNVPQTGGVNSANNVPQSSEGSIGGPNFGSDARNPGGSISGNSEPNVGDVNNVYLPPQTTPRSVFTSRATTMKPSTAATTPISVDGSTNDDYDYDTQQPTEASSNQDGSDAGPNISVSTAVAGADNFFYVQQPDGRLQRVVLQKTQEPDSKPGEYVANYYFQNIQALPNAGYAPLISLGAYPQK